LSGDNKGKDSFVAEDKGRIEGSSVRCQGVACSVAGNRIEESASLTLTLSDLPFEGRSGGQASATFSALVEPAFARIDSTLRDAEAVVGLTAGFHNLQRGLHLPQRGDHSLGFRAHGSVMVALRESDLIGSAQIKQTAIKKAVSICRLEQHAAHAFHCNAARFCAVKRLHCC
jgi:hypothetical protein